MSLLPFSYHPILINNNISKFLEDFLEEKEYDKIFILLDENIYENCYAHFIQYSEKLLSAELLEIESGEQNKNLDIVNSLWYALIENKATRNSLLINFGGGVISDMGGFLAATFKRGIDFINVPTTLLAQVDASIGGKTGVDLGPLKNQVGVFAFPQAVLIDSAFLKTLDERQFNNGMAEIIKHAFICEKSSLYNHLKKEIFDDFIPEEVLRQAVEGKTNIIEKDPKEKNERKKLNFGHTLGHALESWFLAKGKQNELLHGEAVAFGMIAETFIAFKKGMINQAYFSNIENLVNLYFAPTLFKFKEVEEILPYLFHDKKNNNDKILAVLPCGDFQVKIDCEISIGEAKEAFAYYISKIA